MITTTRRWVACAFAAGAALIAASARVDAAVAGAEKTAGGKREKVIQIPIRTDGPKSLDPARGSTTYDNQACAQVYETLVQYKYLKRPSELEPLLLEEMPAVSDGENGTQVWRFKLKRGVRFHDDPCFPGGKGRELLASDVFYSWKRLADDALDRKNWWLVEDTIVGFDRYMEEQNAAARGGGKFDYDAPVEGMRILNDYEFEVVLTKPVYRFIWVLGMFQLSVVPREAVETYGSRFGIHPVGTGPFTVSEGDWKPGESIVFKRNPNYHEQYYPAESMPEDAELGFDAPAGTRLPIVDRVEVTMYVPDAPLWLDFQNGKLGYIQVPAEYFERAYNRRTKRLRPEFVRRGVVSHAIPLLDFIFRGFNMEDPVVGGYTPQKRALRQAISLAVDLEEFNESFYNGLNIIYDGPIPPGLDGYPKDGRAPVSYRGPNLQRARELMARAGYPDGRGLPEIEFYVDRGGNSPEQVQMLMRQLSKIGVRINPRLVDFSTLIESVNNKKAPFFSFAWGSDYPDAENNLALFYGPWESPGLNHYNYKNPEYDRLYERIRVMPPSEERTRLYEQMRDMIIEDVPYVGSMARTRYYLVNPWLRNFKPSEDFYNWYKYLDVDDSKR